MIWGKHLIHIYVIKAWGTVLIFIDNRNFLSIDDENVPL